MLCQKVSSQTQTFVELLLNPLEEAKVKKKVQGTVWAGVIFCWHLFNDLFREEVSAWNILQKSMNRVKDLKLNRIVSTALKKAFVADKSIQKMAKEDFIMLNLMVNKDLTQ